MNLEFTRTGGFSITSFVAGCESQSRDFSSLESLNQFLSVDGHPQTRILGASGVPAELNLEVRKMLLQHGVVELPDGAGPFDLEHPNEYLMWRKLLHQQIDDKLLTASEYTEGLGKRDTDQLLSVIVVTSRPSHLKFLLRNWPECNGQNDELIIVTHGWRLDISGEPGITFGKVPLAMQLLEAPASADFAEAFARGLAASSHELVVKMDDDDAYRANFLDQVRRSAPGFGQISGIAPEFVCLPNLNVVVQRSISANIVWNWYRPGRPGGGSFVIRLSGAEKTDLVSRLSGSGRVDVQIGTDGKGNFRPAELLADSFSYTYFRYGVDHGHAWPDSTDPRSRLDLSRAKAPTVTQYLATAKRRWHVDEFEAITGSPVARKCNSVAENRQG